MKYSEKCRCCGHRAVAYTHNLNKPMLSSFVRFVQSYLEKRRPINYCDELGFTHSQICNFAKLQYYGLVKKINNRSWVPTKTGLGFYKGDIAVLVPVATINNEIISGDHPAWETHSSGRKLKKIGEIDERFYKQWEEYAAEKSGQSSFL